MSADVPLIEFPTVPDPRGNLTFLEGEDLVPFSIQRVFYIYGVPEGGVRAGHAHRALHEIIIALSGSFDVILDDGNGERSTHLCKPNLGLHVHPLTWRQIQGFSPGSVCLVLASEHYNASDYIRDYDTFLEIVRTRE